MPPLQPTTTKSTQPKLDWLFTAYFKDGTSLTQNADDKSLTRTDGTGSAFTDVLVREKELIGFELVNGTQQVHVDLINGAFVVNGTPLHAHNQSFEPEKYPLELVYFRETRVDQNVDKEGNILGTSHYVNRYFIGWKTTVHGKSKQITLAVG